MGLNKRKHTAAEINAAVRKLLEDKKVKKKTYNSSVKVRGEISSWLESLTPDEVNNIICDSLEMWRPTQ